MVGPPMVRTALTRVDEIVGGPARRRVIVVLACVLALDSADKATVGTSSTQLQSALGIGEAQIGLLLTVSSLVGAVATIPFGVLADRVDRTRLLAGGVSLWGIAMALSGASTSYAFLLIARACLGAVVAVAGPAIASLVGDFFPQAERGRMYGFILSGELVGAGFGFLVAGQFATVSWRVPFFILVLPSAVVCWLLIRLPEPARDGQAQLAPGTEEFPAWEDRSSDREPADSTAEPSDDRVLAHEAVRAQNVHARRSAVLDGNADKLSTRQAIRYVLSVRTNVILIVASALGYFFFSGLRGFAIEFTKKHYGLSQHGATSLTVVLGVGALAGVLSGGRLADRMLRNGRLAARTEVPGCAVLLSGTLFIPALITTSLGAAIPLLMLAALCLGAANPPLDAARLDIIHPAVWGRAEATRTVLRNCGDAAAPLLFGVLAQSVFGGTNGLEYTFLIMLVTIFAAAAVTLLIARQSYPHDVAAAAESIERGAKS